MKLNEVVITGKVIEMRVSAPCFRMMTQHFGIQESARMATAKLSLSSVRPEDIASTSVKVGCCVLPFPLLLLRSVG